MLTDGESTENKEAALYFVSNCLGEDLEVTQLLLERTPNLFKVCYKLLENQREISLAVINTVSWCFRNLVMQNQAYTSDLPEICTTLSILLRVSLPEERGIALAVFAQLSDTNSEQRLSMLTAGNTIEVLIGIA